MRTSHGGIYGPFMVNLLPKKQFCSSYTLDGIAGFDNRALLIVPTNEQAGINLPVPGNVQWRVINGSDYSWTELVYPPGADRHKVNHPNASFVVYSVGVMQVNGYGAPAPCTARGTSIQTCFTLLFKNNFNLYLLIFFILKMNFLNSLTI